MCVIVVSLISDVCVSVGIDGVVVDYGDVSFWMYIIMWVMCCNVVLSLMCDTMLLFGL